MPLLATTRNISLLQDFSEIIHAPVLDVQVSRFASGEVRVRITEPHFVKSEQIVIVQTMADSGSSSADGGGANGVDASIVEYLNLVAALRHAGAAKITSIFPWLGYSLQDRVFYPGESNAFEVARTMVLSQPVESTVCMDIHEQSSIPGWNHVSAWPMFGQQILAKYPKEEILLVSPDDGSESRVQQLGASLDLPSICLAKERHHIDGSVKVYVPEHHSFKVKGLHCVLMDDVLNTGTTLIQAAQILKDLGAASVEAYVTHGLLVKDAVSQIQKSSLDAVVLTDSVPSAKKKVEEAEGGNPKITCVSCVPVLQEALRL